jgi:hypothetical protein
MCSLTRELGGLGLRLPLFALNSPGIKEAFGDCTLVFSRTTISIVLSKLDT